MNRYKQLLISLFLLFFLTTCNIWFPKIGGTTELASLLASNMNNIFVTRSGSALHLGGKQFRFAGANISWLGIQENDAGGVSYPSRFRVDDALATAALMGETVVRSHTLGISVGCSICLEPGLNTFNENAFQHIDYAIQSARHNNIRLIIPLIDNWHYYHGGRHTFTDWRGISDENQFYTNSTVNNDFKHYISVILNHKNQYNGIQYKNDPTIMAWETGNELSAPFIWVKDIANYIKSLDAHHLIMDGNNEQDDQSTHFLPDLSIDAIDLYTGHYYPPSIPAVNQQVGQANKAGKVFIVGEYDWNINQGDTLSKFLQAIEHSKIAGDIYWSVFPHDDAHGFVIHNEHFTLHYPGDSPDMRNRVRLLYTHAYAMHGLPVPSHASPGRPVISSVVNGRIFWRGALGADRYSVERSIISANGPWTVICARCVTDTATPWIDTSSSSGTRWYRVRAFSLWGVPGAYSNQYKAIFHASSPH